MDRYCSRPAVTASGGMELELHQLAIGRVGYCVVSNACR
jgi:hypothetical protein